MAKKSKKKAVAGEINMVGLYFSVGFLPLGHNEDFLIFRIRYAEANVVADMCGLRKKLVEAVETFKGNMISLGMRFAVEPRLLYPNPKATLEAFMKEQRILEQMPGTEVDPQLCSLPMTREIRQLDFVDHDEEESEDAGTEGESESGDESTLPAEPGDTESVTDAGASEAPGSDTPSGGGRKKAKKKTTKKAGGKTRGKSKKSRSS